MGTKTSSRKPRTRKPAPAVAQEPITKQTASQPEPQAEPTEKRSFSSVNEVRLRGRLVADPDLRYTPGDNIPFCRLRVATNDRAKAEFHTVVVWRVLAEQVADAFNTGSPIQIDGYLHWRTWRSAEGHSSRGVEVVATSVTGC